MGKQVSKRRRDRLAYEHLRPVVNGRSGTKIDDQVWIYRKVDERSSQELQKLTRTLREASVRPKLSNLTLSLVHPADINMSIKKSPLRGFVSAEDMLGQIDLEQIPSRYDNVDLDVTGLSHYGHSTRYLGVDVSSPVLEEEREHLLSTVQRYLGDNSFRMFRPHVSIAYGEIESQSALRKIEDELPAVISLNALRISQSKVI